jgi:hypothetical protein
MVRVRGECTLQTQALGEEGIEETFYIIDTHGFKIGPIYGPNRLFCSRVHTAHTDVLYTNTKADPSVWA